MLDHEPKGGGKPISIFESARCCCISPRRPENFSRRSLRRYDAIMDVLADGRARAMAGQNHHFRNYAQEKIKYAIDRYVNETNRLYGVLKQAAGRSRIHRRRLFDRGYGELSWIVPYKNQEQNIDDFRT